MQEHREYPLDPTPTAEPRHIGDNLYAAYHQLLGEAEARAAHSGLIRVETVPDAPMPDLVVTGPNRSQRRDAAFPHRSARRCK